MPIEAALTALINSTAPVTALIGNTPTRFYPDAIPQGSALPAIAYQRISSAQQRPLRGKASLFNPLFQLTIWANSAAERRQVKTALIEALTAVQNTVYAGVRIDAILIDDDRDERDDPTLKPKSFIDIRIWHGTG